MPNSNPQFIIVMGVAGSGKTTIAEALAERLGFHFCDADDYHPKENKEKISGGTPLTDADRLPWLRALSALPQKHDHLVLACSALKAQYRSILVENVVAGSYRFVFLDVSRDELEQRLRRRQGHYMKASMLESQLATLERPRDSDEDYVIVSGVGMEVIDLVGAIVQRLKQ